MAAKMSEALSKHAAIHRFYSWPEPAWDDGTSMEAENLRTGIHLSSPDPSLDLGARLIDKEA